VVMRGDLPLPLTISYARPRVLGADRVAAAVYCARRYRGRSCVVISAGTAVTVDYVTRGGRFAGGAITPGPSMQLIALAANTAALPLVGTVCRTARLPGRDTLGCMAAGVRYGLAGALERIVEEYGKLSGGVDIVVATGGAWPLVAPLVRFAFRYEPDAVLLGTALCARHVLARTMEGPARGARARGRARSCRRRAHRRAEDRRG
jgi:type III pantothenate kinase